MDKNELLSLTREHLAATHNRLPVSFTHGDGVWLWDQDGKRYLDALAGIAVDTLGHGNPRLVNAIATQAQRLIHVSNNYLIPQQAELGGLLAKLRSEEHTSGLQSLMRISYAVFCLKKKKY